MDACTLLQSAFECGSVLVASRHGFVSSRRTIASNIDVYVSRTVGGDVCVVGVDLMAYAGLAIASAS